MMTMNYEERLIRLLAEGELELFHSELNMNFRFPSHDQGLWLKFESGSMEAQIYYSEKGRYLPRALEFVSNILATESGKTEGSKYRIVGASEILKNAAWHKGSHLPQVVLYSGELMKRKYPLMARENAADALKNAASFPGNYVAEAIKYALRGAGPTPRISSGCARAVLYAARHSKQLLETGEVREFLEIVSKDENILISGYATRAHAAIFGK